MFYTRLNTLQDKKIVSQFFAKFATESKIQNVLFNLEQFRTHTYIF